MCKNPKLWIVLAVAAVAVVAFAPGLGAAVPVLLVAACPLSMLAMAGGMAGMASRGRTGSDEPTTPGDADEVARLRAESAELRQRVEP